MLKELVSQLLCELRYNLVEERLKLIPKLIKESTDETEQFNLMREQMNLKDIHTKISKYLGNRIR